MQNLNSIIFSLEKFELLTYTRQNELAARELINLLAQLDGNYGALDQNFLAKPLSYLEANQIGDHVITRITSAITCLFSDKNFQLSIEGYGKLLSFHRWFSTLFGASPFRNADHIILSMNQDSSGDIKNLRINETEIMKFCLLYTPESEIELDLDLIWNYNKVLAAGLCLVLMSPRFLGSSAAHAKREIILPWLTTKLVEIQNINDLSLGILHDVYMGCSYADLPEKHDIKKSINVLIERWLDEVNLKPITTAPKVQKGSKPVMFVLMEWFSASHSIYRTHSRTLEAAKDKFHLIGMGYSTAVDEIGKQVFHEFIEIKPDVMENQLKQIHTLALEKNPSILYMPSVGMFPITMFLANLRIAPIQIMALGHPATSNSKSMDYVLVEEDYVGDSACFSEELILLPSDGMPYRPSKSAENLVFQKPTRDPLVDPVKIAIAATTMKINPIFLDTLAKIVRQSKRKIEFHFLVGFAQGLVHPQVVRVIQSALGNHAVVHAHQPYNSYINVILNCDLFLNPFPFGNTNGIIDTVSAGLMGVCKTGPEVNEHIDQGLFERLNFPSWLVTKTPEEYIKSAIRLIENVEERLALEKEFTGVDKLDTIFEGRPEIMGQKFMELVKKVH